MNEQKGVFINDINGEIIEVTDLYGAIEQCEMCINSPFKMASGHSVADNHRYMLRQLLEIKNQQENKPNGFES